ncbi:hypothetical protein [Megamonas hypermegale]|uniref:hypothetical protein n=1 Tax=Megamonas hypermegale TaxID=158847 RepID=UPI00195A1B9C|nr:hypothetical protein [Megamonas hypermegale]MBM6761955.1 hypothetical protein [Megamonas hypermegale]
MSMVNKCANSGVMSAGIQTVSSAIDVCNGKKTVGEAAGDVAVAGAKGAATAVATGVICSVTGLAVAPVAIGGMVLGGLYKLFK